MYVYFLFSSRRRHTRCALLTGVQTCALPIFDIDLEQIAQVVLRWRGQAQVALLLDRCRFGISLSHDDAAQIGAVFARRVLPDVAANLFAEVHLAIAILRRPEEIGRSSCRERGGQYV